MKQLFTVLLSSLVLTTYAQSFEGTVEFNHENTKGSTKNIYYVKDNLVRLEQFSKTTSKPEGAFVFDLKINNIKFISHGRKVWGDYKPETAPVLKGSPEITKGGMKKLQGQNCQEYTVEYKEENLKIVYYIAKGKFDFFNPLVTLWNRKDKQSTVYRMLMKELPKGSIPMLSIEYGADGKQVSKLEIKKIKDQDLLPEEVAVPEDYKKFQE
jgi:hypothetical protein